MCFNAGEFEFSGPIGGARRMKLGFHPFHPSGMDAASFLALKAYTGMHSLPED